jgi:hypothetical protein
MARMTEIPIIEQVTYHVDWIGIAFATDLVQRYKDFCTHQLLEWRFYRIQKPCQFLIYLSRVMTVMPETHIKIDKGSLMGHNKYRLGLTHNNFSLVDFRNLSKTKRLFWLELESLDQFKRIAQKAFPQAEFTWLV